MKATMIQSRPVNGAEAERSVVQRGHRRDYDRGRSAVKEHPAQRAAGASLFAPIARRGGARGGLAFVAGVMVGAGAPSSAERTASRFTDAWQRGDYRAMHAAARLPRSGRPLVPGRLPPRLPAQRPPRPRSRRCVRRSPTGTATAAP